MGGGERIESLGFLGGVVSTVVMKEGGGECAEMGVEVFVGLSFGFFGWGGEGLRGGYLGGGGGDIRERGVLV